MSKSMYKEHCKHKERHLQEALRMYGEDEVSLKFCVKTIQALYKVQNSCIHYKYDTFEVRNNIICGKCFKIRLSK